MYFTHYIITEIFVLADEFCKEFQLLCPITLLGIHLKKNTKCLQVKLFE